MPYLHGGFSLSVNECAKTSQIALSPRSLVLKALKLLNGGVTEGLVATAMSPLQRMHQHRCSVELAGRKSHARFVMHVIMSWGTGRACRNLGRLPRSEP